MARERRKPGNGGGEERRHCKVPSLRGAERRSNLVGLLRLFRALKSDEAVQRDCRGPNGLAMTGPLLLRIIFITLTLTPGNRTKRASNYHKRMEHTQTISSPLPSLANMPTRPWNGIANAVRLGWYLFLLDFQNQYRLTFFNYGWSGLRPIASVLPLLLVGTQIDLLPKDFPVSYAVFALTGALLFDVFWDSLSSPLYYGRRFRKFVFAQPQAEWAILFAGIFEASFFLCLRLLLVIPFLAFSGISLGWNLLGVIAFIPILVFAGITLALPSVCFNFIYRDLNHVLGFVRQILLWTSGVFFFVEGEGPLTTAFELNPVSYLVAFPRSLLLGLPFTAKTQVIYVVAGVAVIFLASFGFYRSRVRVAVDYII